MGFNPSQSNSPVKMDLDDDDDDDVHKMDGNVTEGPTLFFRSPILKLNVNEELFLVTK